MPVLLVPAVTVVPVLLVPAVTVVPVLLVPVGAVVPVLEVEVNVLEADVLLALCVVLDFSVLSVTEDVPAEEVPDSPPPQPASTIITLPNSAGQTIRPDPNPHLAIFMRPLEYDFVAGRPDEAINQGVA